MAKTLVRGAARPGTAFAMHYPSSDRIEIGWDPPGVNLRGSFAATFTRAQALQLVDEVLDLLDVPDADTRRAERTGHTDQKESTP